MYFDVAVKDMGIFAWSQSVIYCICTLVALITYEATSDTSHFCRRPPYSADVLQFFLIDGMGIQLNGTCQHQFTVGSKIVFQCRNAGVAVLDGPSEISCLSGGNWTDDAPSCRDGDKMLLVEPTDLSRMVDVNGSMTVFCPLLMPDFTVKITCEVPSSEDPSLVFPHVKSEKGRVYVGRKLTRGDISYNREYITLTPPRMNDSGLFSCQDKITGSSVHLEIRFGVFSSATSRPTFVYPSSQRTYEILTGGRLTLKCNVTDSLKVWWEHRTLSRVMIVAARSTLHLDNISLSDQGSYVCVAKGFRGHISESEEQTLIIPVSSSTTSRPTFVFPTSRSTYEILTGGRLTLICNVTDSLKVWWEHRTLSRVMIVATRSILHLDNISLSDQGSYVCVAKGFRGHIAESEEQTLIIPVFSSPTSRPTFVFPTSRRTYERLTGGKLTLTCNVSDSLEVWWEHRTWSRVMIVAASFTLDVDNISLSEQGSYFCVAKGFRGHIAESKAQTLIIPGFAQVLLITPLNYPAQIIAKNLRRAQFHLYSINNETNAGLTFHWGKWLNSENNYNDILGEIRDVVREYTGNLSHVHHIEFWMQGLSFCVKESDDTTAGTLTFSSTTINSTVDSHQLCIAAPDVHRGSRKCYGDLVSPATWKDSVVHNCFKASATDADDNTQVLVQQFFKEVEKSPVTSSNASFISRDLADITSSHNIRKEDIDHVTTILEKVTYVKSSSATVTSNVLETIDNIVSTVAAQEIILASETSSSLIKSLQRQLENVKMGGSNFSANRANIAVEVVQRDNIESSLIFASMKSEDYNISETKLSHDPHFFEQERIQASIHIPQPILQISSNCISSKESGKVSLPVSFTVHRSGALFNDPQATENNLIQNTWVVSASISCEMSNLPTSSHISAWFSPTLHQKLQRKAKCVFWNHDLNGNANGGWSSEGCLDPMIKDSGIYKCSCSHMPKFASFAVLMDLKGSINSKALHILTVIGCVTSIVGLIVTMISYLSVRKFRSSQPKQIVLNLCAALLGLYCCFLIGINRTKHQIVCIIFGGLIHFFCLSTLAWMSVEATQLYILLVKVIGAPVKNFLIKCSLVAWGLPFAVVAVCVAVANDDYSNEFCFPRNTTHVFYIGVLGLVAVMLAYNSVIYIVILWNLSVTSKHDKAKGQTNKDRIVPRLKNAFAISVLLGLTWLFGFLAIGSLRMTFNILFCLFNSLQGFIIFLLFCTREEEVRALWRKWLGIKIAQSMTDGNVNTSEKPPFSTAQRATSYDGKRNQIKSNTSGETVQLHLSKA